jgi:hypothetical protein
MGKPLISNQRVTLSLRNSGAAGIVFAGYGWEDYR